MNKHARFALLFIVLATLIVPSQAVFVRADAAECAAGGGTWDSAANVCNHPQTQSPTPAPTTQSTPTPTSTATATTQPTSTAQATYSPTGSCPPPQPTSCPSGYKLVAATQTGGGCPYNNCEPTSGTTGASPSPGGQSCPSGQYWDSSTNSCGIYSTSPYPSAQGCPSGQYWDGSKCVAGGTGGQSCPSGQHYDFSRQTCVQDDRPGMQCPTGEYYDYGQSKCVAYQQHEGTRCPYGQYNKDGKCVDFDQQGGGQKCGQGEYLQWEGGQSFCKKDFHEEKGCGEDEFYDGFKRACVKQEFKHGKAGECKNIPEGCRCVPDQFGGNRFTCEGEKRNCSEDDSGFKNDLVLGCISQGGKPKGGFDPRGCPTTLCEYGRGRGGFGDEGEFGGHGFFQSQGAGCSSEEERQAVLKKCRSSNQEGAIDFEGDCPVAKCAPKGSHDYYKKGKFDEKYKDLSQFKEIPKEAYKACANEGGEIVKLEGFADCVREADNDEVFIGEDEATEVPDAGTLLKIATDLAQLEVALDQVVVQMQGIANYWRERAGEQAVGVTGLQIADKQASNSDEKEAFKIEVKRYELVADMLKSAKEDLKSIKNDLKEHVDKLSKDDVKEFLLEIRKIKDVRLKNVVKVMLSEDPTELGLTEEVVIDEKTAKEAADAGYDSQKDFAKRFNRCAETTFSPDPSISVHFEKVGDECLGDAKGKFPGNDKELSMTCNVPGSVYPKVDLSHGPDEILPYCKGSMAEELKKHEFFATEDGGITEGSVKKLMDEFKVRSPEQFQRVCPQSKENAQKCLDVLGPNGINKLPPEAIQYLTMLVEGKVEAGEFGMPKEIEQLMKEFGVSSPEEMGEKCGQSQENAKKCLDKLDKFLPPEAKIGLKMLAEGKFPGGGGFGSKGGYPGRSGGGFPPECAEAGITDPIACKDLITSKYQGQYGGQQGGGQFGQQPPGGFGAPPGGGGPLGPPPQQQPPPSSGEPTTTTTTTSSSGGDHPPPSGGGH